jgi:hypothetical protein
MLGKAYTAAAKAVSTVYCRLGDPRTKNALIALLALLSAFGMVAPETATALRDSVLSFAL